MPNTPGDLQTALQVLDGYASDMQHAIDGTGTAAENAIRHYVVHLDHEPIASLAHAMLPPADFDTWYKKALATQRSPRSSGNLNWPDDNTRITLYAELLRRIARNEGLAFVELIERFYDYQPRRFDNGVAQFARDFASFHRAFMRLVSGAHRAS